MITVRQINKGNIEKGQQNSADYVQMLCASPCYLLFFHAAASIVLKFRARMSLVFL